MATNTIGPGPASSIVQPATYDPGQQAVQLTVPTPVDTLVRNSVPSTMQPQSAPWYSGLLAGASSAIDWGTRAYGYIREHVAQIVDNASRMRHITQPARSTSCFATCDAMGRSCGISFANKGDANDVPYSGPQSGMQLMAALQQGYPVKLPVDYKPGGNLTDPNYAADHCVVAQMVAGTDPPRIKIFDPRSSHPDIAEREYTLNMQTGELEGGPYPYRIIDMRFPKNYQQTPIPPMA